MCQSGLILRPSQHRAKGRGTELGWNPQHSDIEDIVRSAWEWHKANPPPRV